MRCGAVIDERTVLDRDLRCEGPALVIRNPRSIIQLNGHTIEPARPCSEEPTVGIAIESTADGTQILGPGLLRGFATGIDVIGAARLQVRDLRIADSCTHALAVHGGDDLHARNLLADRNGGASEPSAAILVEDTERFVLEESSLFQNGASEAGATVDLHGCHDCRLVHNRIVANHGVGLRLDVESRGNASERNVVLGHRPYDVVDEGNDNAFALDIFERAQGLTPPRLLPLIGEATAMAPGVAGCGVMNIVIKPRQTVTVTCPQDPGLRALRNSIVAYRLLNWLNLMPTGGDCDAGELKPGHPGGAVHCTNPDPWPVYLELTCCLN